MTPQEQLKEALFQAQPRQEDGHAVFDIAHSKLWYQSEEQAREFLERRNMELNRLTFLGPETELLAAHARELDLPVPFSLIDLGCGDGTQAAALIPGLRNATEYVAVDINPYFLERAAERMRPLIRTAKLQQEFAQLRLPAGQKVVLLLGNTAGNFEESLLAAIGAQLQQGDLLVVGTCAPADIPLGEHIPTPWILRIPEYLGIPLDALRLHMKRRGGRYEDTFILQEDTVIAHNGKELSLRKNDEIIAAMYYTFSQDGIRTLFGDGFDILHQWARHDAVVTVGKKIT